jgi:murein DD-endopeptidase MepM/ murein hydrolase activator NlpD
MLNLVVTQNVGASERFLNLFRSRSVSGSFTAFSRFAALFALLLWSALGAVQPAAAAGAPQADGKGGPFEAVEPLKAGNADFRQLFASRKKLDRVEHGAIAIPSAMPVSGIHFTSGFGVRSDPFRRRAAMHAGVDLAGPIGTKIYATADGVVDRSQWVNGYGNLVELDHGRGIHTRYGHLSKALVKPGQHVKRGELIALMGSTGRSTGSHLHYEVRVDGKAVNPIPFMQTNDYVLALQNRISAQNSKFAMGGPIDND